MILSRRYIHLLLALVSMFQDLQAVDAAFESHLFKQGTLVYTDDFDGKLDRKRWQIRTKSWEVKDGILVGKPDYTNVQEAMKALKRDHHLGLSPVIRLDNLPKKFVLHLRRQI